MLQAAPRLAHVLRDIKAVLETGNGVIIIFNFPKNLPLCGFHFPNADFLLEAPGQVTLSFLHH